MIPIKSKYWHGTVVANWFYGGMGDGEIMNGAALVERVCNQFYSRLYIYIHLSIQHDARHGLTSSTSKSIVAGNNLINKMHFAICSGRHLIPSKRRGGGGVSMHRQLCHT